MLSALSTVFLALGLAGQAAAHAAPWHPSMYGFNQTTGDNRALDPLNQRHFNTSDEADSWWFHGHLKYPPHPQDIMQLPVGGEQMLEISCDKGTTSYWQSAPGGNTHSAAQPDYPCPGQPLSQFHTTGESDTGGCALAVAYKSNAWEVEPQDFVVFSVNQTCVWSMHTYFEVPADMPPCPNGKCTCAFFWGHQADSGAAQIYMNGFQCNMAGATNSKPLPQGKPARRCGQDQYLNRAADAANCTIGAKQPNYWYQLEENNQFEDILQPPSYQSLYGFMNGRQTDLYAGVGATQPTGTTPGKPATGAPAPTTTKAAASSTKSNALPPASSTSKPSAPASTKSNTLPPVSSTSKPAAPSSTKSAAPSSSSAAPSSSKPATPKPTTSAAPKPTTTSKAAPKPTTTSKVPPPVSSSSIVSAPVVTTTISIGSATSVTVGEPTHATHPWHHPHPHGHPQAHHTTSSAAAPASTAQVCKRAVVQRATPHARAKKPVTPEPVIARSAFAAHRKRRAATY